jgi:hypothetical protein
VELFIKDQLINFKKKVNLDNEIVMVGKRRAFAEERESIE